MSTVPVSLTVSVRRVVTIFAMAITGLMAAHVAGLISKNVFGNDWLGGLVPAFNVGREQNVPTWYSSSALLITALLLGFIGLVRWQGRGRFAGGWIMLGLIFAFLSCDETATLHELSVEPLGRYVQTPLLHFIAWVIPASVLLLVFGAVYLRFFLHLPRRFQIGFLAAGAVYVGGALGMELITGAFGRVVFAGRAHFLFDIMEELLEMGGVVLFIAVLLDYCRRELGDLTVRIT